MEGMIVGLRGQWGTWDDYVADIGVEPEVVEALRAALLTGP
jgi:hypothetical protein